MKPFYLFLMALWGAFAVYTGQVVATHGVNFFSFYLADIARWNWPGQFDLDLTILLFLAASWIAWRHRFSPLGWGLAALTMPFASIFLLPYVTYLAARHGGDTRAILLGRQAERGAA